MKTHWLLVILLVIATSPFIFYGYTVVRQSYVETQAKKRYRSIKAGMDYYFQDHYEDFLNLWETSEHLPEIHYLNTLSDGQIELHINRKSPPSHPEKSKWQRVIPDYSSGNLLPTFVNDPAKSNEVQTKETLDYFRLGSQGYDRLIMENRIEDQLMIYSFIADSIICLPEKYYMTFHGFPDENDFEVVLKLAGLTKDDFESLEDRLSRFTYSCSFRKDKNGSIFLGYLDIPCDGYFEFYMPKGVYEWKAYVKEMGVIDREVGIFWNFGTSPVKDFCIGYADPYIIQN